MIRAMTASRCSLLPATASSLPPVLLYVRCHGDLAAGSGISRGLHHLGLAGLAVPHQHRHGDSPRRAAAAAGLDALARRPLGLVPVVLKPNLHLGRRQPDDGGEVLALGRAQIPLLAEAPFELEGLRLGE